MEDKRINYRAYLLRIWQITDPDWATGDPRWVLEVESVQSGEIWKIKRLEDLLLLLKQLTGKP